LLFATVWLRASLPAHALRRLMALGWKYLIEIAILWVLVSTALLVGATRLALVRRGAGFRRDRGSGVRHADLAMPKQGEYVEEFH